MGKIVMFVENGDVNASPYLYVKSYRPAGFLRRERIEYSYFEYCVVPNELQERVFDCIKRDYPDCGEWCIRSEDNPPEFPEQTFWVIREHASGRFYAGTGHKGFEFCDAIWDAEVSFAKSDAKETLAVLRRASGLKLALKPIVLSCVNKLTHPEFTITCTSRKSGVTKYYARNEDGRLRLVETSDAAAHFDYEEVMREFEHLRTSNKNFSYAVMPPFRDNVRAKDIEEYLITHKVTRGFVSAMKLKGF